MVIFFESGSWKYKVKVSIWNPQNANLHCIRGWEPAFTQHIRMTSSFGKYINLSTRFLDHLDAYLLLSFAISNQNS